MPVTMKRSPEAKLTNELEALRQGLEVHFHVDHFGAIGDDATHDDTGAFQSAVDAAHAATGGTDRRAVILLGPKTYYVVGLALAGQPVTIRGHAERRSTIQQFSDTDHVITCLHTVATTGVVLEDLNINGGGSTTYDCFIANRMELFAFHRVGFGSGRYGLHLQQDARFGNISDCIFGSTNARGLQMGNGANQNTVAGCWFDENTVNGIRIVNSDNNLIIGNRFQDNTSRHIRIEGTSSGNRIIGNNFQRGSGGTDTDEVLRIFSGANDNCFEGNTVQKHAGTDITIDSGALRNRILNTQEISGPLVISNGESTSVIFNVPTLGNSILVAENTVQTLTNKTLGSGTVLGSGLSWKVPQYLLTDFGGYGLLQNLSAFSSQLDRWPSIGANVTLTANHEAGPHGGTEATRIVSTLTSATEVQQTSLETGAVVSGRTFTARFWMKITAGQSSGVLRIRITDPSGNLIDTNLTPTSSWQEFTASGAATDGGTAIALRFNESAAAAVDVVVWGVRLYEGTTEIPYVQTGPDSLITPVYGSSHNFLIHNALVHQIATRDLAGANGTFTAADGSLHLVDPNGSQNYNPTGTFPAGYQLTIVNTAGAAGETITFDSATLAEAIPRRARGIFEYNGTTWDRVLVSFDHGIAEHLTASSTYDPANLAADGDATSTTITVTGAAVGDSCVATHDQIGANDALISAHVQAANTVRVVLMNKTGGALDIASGTLRVDVFKH